MGEPSTISTERLTVHMPHAPFLCAEQDVLEMYSDLTYYVTQQRKQNPKACSKLRRKTLYLEYRAVTSRNVHMKNDVQEMVTSAHQLQEYTEKFKKEFDSIQELFLPIDIKLCSEELDQLMEDLQHIEKASTQLAKEPIVIREIRKKKLHDNF